MPLMIGAPDMAFPRMNNLSYWLYVAGSSLAVCGLLAPGGNGQLGSGVGWVLYAPLSTSETRHVNGPCNICHTFIWSFFNIKSAS